MIGDRRWSAVCGRGASGMILALSAALTAPPAVAQDTSSEPTFTLEELAPGVWAALVVPNPPSYAFANSLVIVGEDGVTVVDTQQSTTAARALIEEIAGLTDLPVRRVVHTHFHGDHVYGNQAYLEAFPGVEFIAHSATRELVLTENPTRIAEEIETLPASIDDRARWIETGIGPSGQELTEEQVEAVRRSHWLRSEYLEMLRGLELVPPTVVFEDRLTLHDGVRPIELIFVGPAHTAGDILVYLPMEEIVGVGDLVEAAFPWFGDAWPAGWAEAMDRIAALEAPVMLPSHGPVLRGEELDQLFGTERSMIRSLAEQAASAVAAGTSREAFVDQVDLEEYRAFFTGGDPRRDAGFDGSVAEAAGVAWDRASEGASSR